MPTGLFNTQNTVGIREDLTNVLTNISPLETPFFSSIGRTKATNTLHEWQTITLAAAAANANVEGASATPASGNTTTRVGNRTQIFTKPVKVSGTQLNVDEAGRANEWAFQLDLKAKELARDIEYQLVGSTAAAAGDVSGDTARQLEGLGFNAATNATAGWLSSNVETLLTTASDTGTRKNMSETNFNNLLQTCWTAGGKPDAIHTAAYLKRVISSFSANATRYSTVQFSDGMLKAPVSVYESDFGIVRIYLNRYIAVTALAAIETQYWAVAELRPTTFTKLAATGDAEFGQYVSELTLAAYAYTSSGKLIGAASAAGATT